MKNILVGILISLALFVTYHAYLFSINLSALNGSGWRTNAAGRRKSPIPGSPKRSPTTSTGNR
jgi:hypothetical protein